MAAASNSAAQLRLLILDTERAIHDHKGLLVRTQVGDRYVVEEMRKHGYNLGGEQSGHLVFLDHATTGLVDRAFWRGVCLVLILVAGLGLVRLIPQRSRVTNPAASV